MDRYAAHVALERRADWLVMAARLVVLRSRLCFPASREEQEAAEREVRDTRRQLDELCSVRAAVAWLEARPQLGRDVFGRPGGVSPCVSSYMDLLEACLAVLLREEDLEQQQAGEWATTLKIRPAALYPVAAIIASLRAQMGDATSAQRLESLAPPVRPDANDRALAARMALSATLIAALELGRGGELTLLQDEDGETIQPVVVQGRAQGLDDSQLADA